MRLKVNKTFKLANTNNINVETYQIDDVRKIKDLGEFKSTFSKNGYVRVNLEFIFTTLKSLE